MFHRAESTIANEVENRMIWSNRGYGCTNADCVTLDPSLLGPEFRREADNTILRKKGVVE